jgi:hypothetical protein
MKNTQKSELRKLLDMFEGAGFMVMHYQSIKMYQKDIRYVSYLIVSVKSERIKDAYKDFEDEKTSASAVCALLEEQDYRVRNCTLDKNLAYDYGGTFYLELIPPSENTKQVNGSSC